MIERKDYGGPFDPDFRYEDLSKEALVRLVREFALIAHLLDRSGLAAVGMPYGERAVTGMCHTIEDGTFDVTAQAVNPKARIRHVHRPPRVPADRMPHCRWEVVIDDDTETLPEADITALTRRTTAARFDFPP